MTARRPALDEALWYEVMMALLCGRDVEWWAREAINAGVIPRPPWAKIAASPPGAPRTLFRMDTAGPDPGGP